MSAAMQAALVRAVLEKWASYDWTVQGFGFIRTKIANVGRIHVWDSSVAVKRVSTMHTHPWDLRSTIISGELINQRFQVTPFQVGSGMPYLHCRLKTGEGGGLIGEPNAVSVLARPPEFFQSGESYEQLADEVHRSIPQDGTVTLLERTQGPPLEEASVYWPDGTEWVSAEPRKAETWEVGPIIKYALARWSAP